MIDDNMKDNKLPEELEEYKVGDKHPPKEHQWRSGQSGNPGGRPVGKSITAELRKLLDSGTNAEELAKILYALCKRLGPDQMRALNTLLDRTDGKVPDTHKIESDIPINLTFKLIKGDKDE